MKVVKRNGTRQEFWRVKIELAIFGAMEDVLGESVDDPSWGNYAARLAEEVEAELQASYKITGEPPTVEEIQDVVEEVLMEHGEMEILREYIRYRYEHEIRRRAKVDDSVLQILEDANDYVQTENSNKNSAVASTQRDYLAGEVSKDISRRYLLTEDIIGAHDEGIIHFHDMDYYAMHIYNCCLVNLEDMLQNGTVVTNTLIERPHSFSTACNIATQIIAQVASNQYGGQTISLAHLAPFVEETRARLINRYGFARHDWRLEQMVAEDISRGVQTIQYQILTLMTTNGQTPFVSVNMDINEVPEGQTRDDLAKIIEEVLKQRIQGVKNAQGVWVTPAFPKLLYVLDENNVDPNQEYYYLTELAAKCTAKRMVPDYISAKKMRELKNGDNYPCMGCRSFLTPRDDHKYYGRFNQGVVTINLVDVALTCRASSDPDLWTHFWTLLDGRLELCHKALRLRHERLLGTTSDVAPILWQHGAIARLKPGEKIDELLFNNYSTISLGYAGLYECVMAMLGESHTTKKGEGLAKKILQKMNDKCATWRKEEGISYSVYGTPIESTTYKFATCLKKRFGIIPEVTDHDYITNSYHVNVREEINAFDKLRLEAGFQELSPGGAISYVEVPDLQDNIPAVLELIKFIYDNIMYAELNCKSDYCMVCSFDGEMEIVEQDNGHLDWRCPKCGNTDKNKLQVTRRVCGYLGTNYFNQGRTQEIRDRVLHL